MIEKITKRNGTIVDFMPSKIERAIEKAFIATQTPYTAAHIEKIQSSVISTLEERFIERVPNVEDVQDIVEKELAQQGYFDVAKAYILYRAGQQELREQKQRETLEKIEKKSLKIKKRNGSLENFDVEQIREAVSLSAKQYKNAIDIEAIVRDAELTMYDGITTSDINKSIIMALRARIEKDPAHSFIAARFLFNDLYKEIIGTDESDPLFEEKYRTQFKLSIQYGIEDGRFDPSLAEFDIDMLSKELQPEQDHLFQYLGDFFNHVVWF